MSEITPGEAKTKYGISARHNIMNNGERRFRLIDEQGLGYVRTDAGKPGAWQKSHVHHMMHETYIVQSGWLAVATLNQERKLELQILKEGDTWSSLPGVAHNIYMSGNSISHVVKHGNGTADDWCTNETTQRLDRMTTNLTEEEILGFGG